MVGGAARRVEGGGGGGRAGAAAATRAAFPLALTHGHALLPQCLVDTRGHAAPPDGVVSAVASCVRVRQAARRLEVRCSHLERRAAALRAQAVAYRDKGAKAVALGKLRLMKMCARACTPTHTHAHTHTPTRARSSAV